MDARFKRCSDLDFDAPVAQAEKSNSLLRSRLKVRALPGALRDARTDSSTVEPPAFNREVVSSNLTRCTQKDGSVAQFGKRRLAQNEEVAGSNPARTTVLEKHEPNWLMLALLYGQHFKSW